MKKVIGQIEGRKLSLFLLSVVPETMELVGVNKTATLLISYNLEVAGYGGLSAKIDSGYFMSSLLELVGEKKMIASPLAVPGLVGSWEMDLTQRRVVSEIPGSMRLEVALKEISPASPEPQPV